MAEAHRLWSAGELVIIDCREEAEHEATRVEGVPLIPMSELLARVDELPDRHAARDPLPQRGAQRAGGRLPHRHRRARRGGQHQGGIIAWAAEGLPYEGESPR